MLLTVYEAARTEIILFAQRKNKRINESNLLLSSFISLTTNYNDLIISENFYNYTEKTVSNIPFNIIKKILQNIIQFTYFHFLQLYLSIYCFKLSFITNAKELKTIENTLELAFQLYNITAYHNISTYINNIIYFNLFEHYLKTFNIIKFKKQLYFRPGSPYLRIKKNFPAINIAS